VEARLEDLSARIRRLGYRPEPVRRSYIRKGAGNELAHGRDIVAPPGNQAATENTNFCLPVGETPAYSPISFCSSIPTHKAIVIA
jgi:hypothetical protein